LNSIQGDEKQQQILRLHRRKKPRRPSRGLRAIAR
jgi:hypothetical protein